MNYANLFEVTYVEFKDSCISFELHEFLEPTRFRPKKNVLSQGCTRIHESYPHDGKYIDRLKYFKMYERYTLRFRTHAYKIHLSQKPKDLMDFVRDYFPLIVKYEISPSYTSDITTRYNKTTTPIANSEAYRILNADAEAFFQKMNLHRPHNQSPAR